MRFVFYFIVGLMFVAAKPSFAQVLDSVVISNNYDNANMKAVLVSGDGFLFSVIEPDGWKSDTENAKDFDANIVLFMSNDSVNAGAALVQMLSFKKADDSTELDLKSDLEQYKNNFPDLMEEDFETQHPQYKCYGKCVYVEGDFFQYLVYINPGPKYRRGVSAALNTAKRRPTDEEMRGFRQIVYSVVVFK